VRLDLDADGTVSHSGFMMPMKLQIEANLQQWVAFQATHASSSKTVPLGPRSDAEAAPARRA